MLTEQIEAVQPPVQRLRHDNGAHADVPMDLQATAAVWLSSSSIISLHRQSHAALRASYLASAALLLLEMREECRTSLQSLLRKLTALATWKSPIAMYSSLQHDNQPFLTISPEPESSLRNVQAVCRGQIQGQPLALPDPVCQAAAEPQ